MGRGERYGAGRVWEETRRGEGVGREGDTERWESEGRREGREMEERVEVGFKGREEEEWGGKGKDVIRGGSGKGEEGRKG